MAMALTPEAEQLNALKDVILKQLSSAAKEAVHQNDEAQLREAVRSLQIATDLYPDDLETQRIYTECLRKLWDIQNAEDARQRLRTAFEANFNSFKAQRKLLEAIYLAVDSAQDKQKYLSVEDLENKCNLRQLIEDWLGQGDLYSRDEAIRALRQELKGLPYEKQVTPEEIEKRKLREQNQVEDRMEKQIDRFLSSPDDISPLFNAERELNKLVEMQPAEAHYADARDATMRMQTAVREAVAVVAVFEQGETVPNLDRLVLLLSEAGSRSRSFSKLRDFAKAIGDWRSKASLLQELGNAIRQNQLISKRESDALQLNNLRKSLEELQNKVLNDQTSAHHWKTLDDLKAKLINAAKSASEDLKKKIFASLNTRSRYWQNQIGALPEGDIEFENAWGKLKQWSASEDAQRLNDLESEMFSGVKFEIKSDDVEGVFKGLLSGKGKGVVEAVAAPRYGELIGMMQPLAKKYQQTKDSAGQHPLRETLIAQDTRAAFADSERRNSEAMKDLASKVEKNLRQTRSSVDQEVTKLSEETTQGFKKLEKDLDEKFAEVRTEEENRNKQLKKRQWLLFGGAIAVGLLASLIPWLLFAGGNIKAPNEAPTPVAALPTPVSIIRPAGSVFAAGEGTVDANGAERYRLHVSTNVTSTVLQVSPARAQIALESGTLLNKDGNGFWELPDAAEQTILVLVPRGNGQPSSGAQVSLYQRQNKIYSLFFSSPVFSAPLPKPGIGLVLPKEGIVAGMDNVITLTSALPNEAVIKLPGGLDVKVDLSAGVPHALKLLAAQVNQAGKAAVWVGGDVLASFDVQPQPVGAQITQLPWGQMIRASGKTTDTIVLTYTIVNTSGQPLNANAVVEAAIPVITQTSGASVTTTSEQIFPARVAIQALLTQDANWSGLPIAISQTIAFITPTQMAVVAIAPKDPVVLNAPATFLPAQLAYFHVFITLVDAKGSARTGVPIAITIAIKDAKDGKELFRATPVFEFDGSKFTQRR